MYYNMTSTTNIKKYKKLKKSKTRESSSQTISGLPKSAWTSNVIAAATGLFIFLLGPYLVNMLNAPATAALVNVVPNGLIMALFIEEKDFHEFFSAFLYAPMFNVLLTWAVYPFYYYGYLTPIQTIWTEVSVWTTCCILSYIFKDHLIFL